MSEGRVLDGPAGPAAAPRAAVRRAAGPEAQARQAMAAPPAARPAGPRPAAPAPPAPAQPVRERVPAAEGCGTAWYAAVPGRVWFALRLLAAPAAILGWLLDKAVAALVVGVAAVLWAWWTGRIADDQVAAVLAQAGGRLLGIATKAGLL